MAAKNPRKLVHQFIDLAHSDMNLKRVTELLEEHPGLLTAIRPGKDKETAFGAATHSRAEGVIQLLLDRGQEMDIFAACALGNTELVVRMLDANPALVKKKARHAHKLDLMDLAPNKDMQQLLLSRGFPMTIHVASKKGLFEQVERYLDADISQLESVGRHDVTPLLAAIWGQQPDMAIYLLERGARHDDESAGGRPMSYACCWADSKVAGALLERGIEIEYVGFFYGFTHLHACCYWGEEGMGNLTRAQYTKAALQIIGWLFEAGVDPTVCDKEGRTAYELALSKGFTERADLIKLLT